MDIELVANEARRSISNFCKEECKAYCCRKGHLKLTLKEAELITQNRIKEFKDRDIIIQTDEKNYALSLGKSCPRLSDSSCTIHKNKLRPLVCKQYPIFVEGKSIRLSSGCPAVAKKILYEFECKFLNLGYKLEC